MKVWMQDTVDWIHFTACYDRWMFIWPLVIAVLLTVVRVVANGIFLKVNDFLIGKSLKVRS